MCSVIIEINKSKRKKKGSRGPHRHEFQINAQYRRSQNCKFSFFFSKDLETLASNHRDEFHCPRQSQWLKTTDIYPLLSRATSLQIGVAQNGEATSPPPRARNFHQLPLFCFTSALFCFVQTSLVRPKPYLRTLSLSRHRRSLLSLSVCLHPTRCSAAVFRAPTREASIGAPASPLNPAWRRGSKVVASALTRRRAGARPPALGPAQMRGAAGERSPSLALVRPRAEARPPALSHHMCSAHGATLLCRPLSRRQCLRSSAWFRSPSLPLQSQIAMVTIAFRLFFLFLN